MHTTSSRVLRARNDLARNVLYSLVVCIHSWIQIIFGGIPDIGGSPPKGLIRLRRDFFRSFYRLRFSQFSVWAEGFSYFGLQIRILQANLDILPAVVV